MKPQGPYLPWAEFRKLRAHDRTILWSVCPLCGLRVHHRPYRNGHVCGNVTRPKPEMLYPDTAAQLIAAQASLQAARRPASEVGG